MAERIESIWDRVGRSDELKGVSERVVRDVVRDPNKPHDEILQSQRLRECNLGKWYREKNSETSTLDPLLFCSMNDSMLLERVPFLLLMVMEEMMELRSSAVPLR